MLNTTFSQPIQKNRPRSAFLDIISTKFQELGVLEDFQSAFLALKKIFPEEQFFVKQPSPKECESRLVLITYREDSNNWTVLGRKCRGCILHYSKTGKLTLVKVLLDRGAELLTGVHSTTTNESMSREQTSHLDSVQQELIRRLSNTTDKADDFKSTLVGKTDGSLFGIGIHPNPENVNNYVTICPFASEVARQCKELVLPLFILNSKGTCILPEAMWSWTVTAILCDFGGMSFESLKSLVNGGRLSPVDALKLRRLPTSKYTILQELMLKLINLQKDIAKNHLDEDIISDDITYFIFETVCPNRKCAWGTKHAELTIAYESSVLRLLGMTYGIGEYEEQYRPAYQFADEIDSHGLNQPCYWHLDTVKQIQDMTLNLGEVARGTMALKEFLELHPPNGGSTDSLDLEGYIIHVPIDIDGTSKTLSDSNGHEWGPVEYDKIKTDLYYKSHKLRAEYMRELLSLPVSTHTYLPLVAKLYQLVNHISKKLAHVISDVNHDIKNYGVHDSIGTRLYETIPEKAKAPFQRMKQNVQRKMLINQGNKGIWWDYLIDVFAGYSLSIDVTESNKKSVGQLLSNIISTPKLVELDTNIVALEEYISTELLHIKDGIIEDYKSIPSAFWSFIKLLMNE